VKGIDEAMNSKEISLEVLGMTCRSCAGHVNAALSALDGVSKVEVRFRDGKVVVEYTPELVDESALIEALREAGYESSVSVAA
jgi:copper chaperone CopZ